MKTQCRDSARQPTCQSSLHLSFKANEQARTSTDRFFINNGRVLRDTSVQPLSLVQLEAYNALPAALNHQQISPGINDDAAWLTQAVCQNLELNTRSRLRIRLGPYGLALRSKRRACTQRGEEQIEQNHGSGLRVKCSNALRAARKKAEDPAISCHEQIQWEPAGAGDDGREGSSRDRRRFSNLRLEKLKLPEYQGTEYLDIHSSAKCPSA